MKVATWNIAGGRKMRSLKTFDYEEKPNVDYFIEQLRNIDADYVCMQESEQPPTGDSIAKQIANGLGMDYLFETHMQKSHVNPDNWLNLAIISKSPIENQRSLVLPYPDFELTLPNGKPAAKLDKYMQIATINGIQVVNIMNQPMEFLGHRYDSELGQKYTAQLDAFYLDQLSPSQMIFSGDFNTYEPTQIFHVTISSLGLKDALPQDQTKPQTNGRFDRIYISEHFDVVQSAVIQTETDHFLCWAQLQ